MATRRDFHKVIIGRSEEISFVGWGIHDIPAKTDTGAYRSSVHARNIFIDENSLLHFTLLGGHPICGKMAKEMTSEKYKEVWIANSFGHGEKRYEVKLQAKLGPKIFSASFTLSDRSKKIYPILLGRKLLNERFLVDPGESSLNRIELKQKYNIAFPNDEEEGRE
ncbi:MAG: ATP-dependent zinc protease [Candidatus Nomurabacteria bacterium]|jgi:hypothetical protein|nr:ATP-dependent zinc protease [Candidatus Nomurabacteria bacterium]